MKARLLNIALEFMMAGIVLAILFRRWHAQQEARDDAEFDAAAGELYRQGSTYAPADAISLDDLESDLQ